MKKRLIGASVLAAAMCGALALRAKDPVVMNVNGEDVPLSEFEYLYHKNRQQQATLQPITDYADIFKIYKLKVADAKAMGIDTTAAFKKEYAQYRSELAQPYLVDSVYINSLVADEYSRMSDEVLAYHIIRFKTKDANTNAASLQLLDSIHSLLNNGADFGELAEKYSQDKSSAKRGGLVGWVLPMHYPYAFESMVYNTKPGEISKVFDSGSVYHIVKVADRRKNEGRMSASHIMKMVPRDAPEEEQIAAKAKIDSIYNVLLTEPGLFEKMAVYESDDQNSSRKGGILPPFYRGEMVTEFADKVFTMADNEISEPIRTDFGWHIIKRFSQKPIESYDEMKPKVLQYIKNPADPRAYMIQERQRKKFAKEFKLKTDKKVADRITSYIAANGIDTLFVEKMLTSPEAASTVYATFHGGAGKITLADFAPAFEKYANLNKESAFNDWTRRSNSIVRKKLSEAKEESLERTEPEYRNLLHEFRDGSLLYEAGRQKVWDRASLDTAGLVNYFNAHKAEYAWKEPRVKGFLIQATNDSVENAVRECLANIQPADYIKTIRKQFPSDVQIDRVLAAKGVNSLVDFCAFGGPEAKPSNAKYTKYFLYDFRILDTPEDISDVRGLVTSDYQNILETEWVDEIQEKYPVTIYPKVLSKVKDK